MKDGIYKVAVSVPTEHLDRLMDAIDGVMGPLYPGYRRCFSMTDTVGTWVPEEGSDPFIGDVGKVATVKETRIEFAVRDEDLERVLRTIDRMHPYEEPAVDVIPMIAWRSLL